MKEHLIIKGMNFIGNQLIEVKLIPDPEYSVKESLPVTKIDYSDLNTVCKSVNEIYSQTKPLERIIYLSVSEWKKNNYSFASKIILEAKSSLGE